MKKLILLILVVMFIPFIAGQTFKLGNNITISEPCFKENGYCSSLAICNITAFDPDNLQIANGDGMANQGTFHNYSISSNYTQKLGDYAYCVTCEDQGINGTSCSSFQITSGGLDPSLPQVLTNFLILGLLILLFIFNIWGFLRLSWQNKQDGSFIMVNYMKHVKTLLFVTAYALLLFITYSGWSMSQQLIFLDFAQPFFRTIFMSLLILVFPAFVIFWAYTIISIVRDKKLNKAILRGLPKR